MSDTLIGILLTIVMTVFIFGIGYFSVKSTYKILKSYKMSAIGTLLIIIGTIALISSFMMDTSVALFNDRINNIGLMADKQNYIVISGLILLIGVLINLFCKRKVIK